MRKKTLVDKTQGNSSERKREIEGNRKSRWPELLILRNKHKELSPIHRRGIEENC